MNVVSDRGRGTIWWDFDGTLASRPLMWSRAARHLIERAEIACDALPGPLLEVLNKDMPWHGPNRGHPELSTPDIWWARVFAALRCAIPGAPIWMIGDNAECDCHPVGAFGANAILIRAAAPAFGRHAADLWQAARLITSS